MSPSRSGISKRALLPTRECTGVEVTIPYSPEGGAYIEIHIRLPFMDESQAFHELCVSDLPKIIGHCIIQGLSTLGPRSRRVYPVLMFRLSVDTLCVCDGRSD